MDDFFIPLFTARLSYSFPSSVPEDRFLDMLTVIIGVSLWLLVRLRGIAQEQSYQLFPQVIHSAVDNLWKNVKILPG